MAIILALSLIFKSGFEPPAGSSITFFKGTQVTVATGCKLTSQHISDKFVYLINHYLFECQTGINARVNGTDHHSAVFINGVGLFCDIDFFELRSRTDFELIIDCN